MLDSSSSDSSEMEPNEFHIEQARKKQEQKDSSDSSDDSAKTRK